MKINLNIGPLVASGVHPFWRGHLFLFDRQLQPTYSPRQGGRLLLVFALVEFLLRPLSGLAAQRLMVAGSLWWPATQVSLLTLLASFLLVRSAGLSFSQVGLYSWIRWSRAERFYFVQVVPLSVLIFSFFVFSDLRLLWIRSDLWKAGASIFVTKLIWGFYQELLYRGLLQTELVRRLGALTGICVSNLVFTFGPLHAYHFSLAQRHPAHLWIFAAIFAIGLFFAAIFQRSGNLWIIAIMHGLGDWFIDGLAQVARIAR